MKRFLILIVCLTTLSLVGCKKNYSGDYPELYTVAIHSLLWNKGFSTKTDKFCDPTIEIIENDHYGRVLFQYTEKSFTSDIAFSSLVIMQFSTKEYVYYYEDFNFIAKEKVSYSDVIVEFDSKEIEKLKECNDWDKELNLDKCTKKEISNVKEKIPIEEEKLKKIYSTYDGYRSNLTYFLSGDEYGRFICYSSIFIIKDDEHIEQSVVILFQKDLSYSIFTPKSIYNYQDELKEFKTLNNWNCEGV